MSRFRVAKAAVPGRLTDKTLMTGYGSE